MKHIFATLIAFFLMTSFVMAQSSGLQSLNTNTHPGYTKEQAKELLVEGQTELTIDGFVEESAFPSLGEQIQEARKEKSVNVAHLASVLGLDAAQMTSIEQGQILPTRELLVQIQLFLDCELVIDAG